MVLGGYRKNRKGRPSACNNVSSLLCFPTLCSLIIRSELEKAGPARKTKRWWEQQREHLPDSITWLRSQLTPKEV
jgi:hypothetical protein